MENLEHKNKLIFKIINNSVKKHSINEYTLNFSIHSMKNCISDFQKEELTKMEIDCFYRNMKNLYSEWKNDL